MTQYTVSSPATMPNDIISWVAPFFLIESIPEITPLVSWGGESRVSSLTSVGYSVVPESRFKTKTSSSDRLRNQPGLIGVHEQYTVDAELRTANTVVVSGLRSLAISANDLCTASGSEKMAMDPCLH